MTLLRQYRFASFMLVLVALIAFSVAVVDLPLLFVSTILAMLSWYVTEGPRGKTLPTWVSNILVVVALAWAVFTFVAGGELAGATSALENYGTALGLLSSALGAHLTWTLPFGLLIMFAVFALITAVLVTKGLALLKQNKLAFPATMKELKNDREMLM